MGHECTRHGVPCYHLSGCYGELKDRLRAGEDLTADELEFVGHYGPQRSERGWRQPNNLSVFELDATLSAEDSATLSALMAVGDSAERLEFLA